MKSLYFKLKKYENNLFENEADNVWLNRTIIRLAKISMIVFIKKKNKTKIEYIFNCSISFIIPNFRKK